MGRSRSAHARSAVKTSAGVLRTVRARQQRSPNDSAGPPAIARIAPASSASSSRTGSIVTPAAANGHGPLDQRPMAYLRRGYGRLGDMGTPSERIFAQLEDDEDETELRDFLPPQARHPMTLARTADRIADGVALREAVADFLDDLRWVRDHDGVAQRIVDRPRDLDPRTDAYLGALAEHVAAERALAVPPWSIEAGRFLVRIWWPRYPGLWARAIVESPAAFRRRGILLGAGMLTRV